MLSFVQRSLPPRTSSRAILVAPLVIIALALSACSGITNPATGVTPTQITLNATVSCSGGVPYPCYFNFAWGMRSGGENQGTALQGPFRVKVTGVHVSATIPVNPGTIVYYKLCGSGDTISATVCANEQKVVVPLPWPPNPT